MTIESVEEHAQEVMAMLGEDALLSQWWIVASDGYFRGEVPESDALAELRESCPGEGAGLLFRADAVAAVGMMEGWAEPVVVRLPRPSEAERSPGVPRHIAHALAQATRAIAEDDGARLCTVNEHIQPLVDAAVARVRGVEAERDALRSTLDDVARRLCRRGWGHERDGAAPHLHDHEIGGRVDDVLVALWRTLEERSSLAGEVEAAGPYLHHLAEVASVLDAAGVPHEGDITHETDEGSMIETFDLDTPHRVLWLAAERDMLRGRLRAVCQTAVEAIGAQGPCDAEEAVGALVTDWYALRAEVARLRRIAGEVPMVEPTKCMAEAVYPDNDDYNVWGEGDTPAAAARNAVENTILTYGWLECYETVVVYVDPVLEDPDADEFLIIDYTERIEMLVADVLAQMQADGGGTDG